MKKIKLTQNKFALVDDEDFEYLSKFNWYYLNGYAVRKVGKRGNQKAVYMHRVVAGTPIGMDTDHKNRNRLDNRKANLRVCTRSQNLANRVLSTVNKNGLRGVRTKTKGKSFYAIICVNRNSIHLGTYETAKEAGEAYNKAAKEFFGEYSSAP